jgi:hypothetical protein
MNGKIIHIAIKTLLTLLIVLFGISFSSELNLIIKVKCGLVKTSEFVTITETGNIGWDSLNKTYCCTELKQISGNFNNNNNTEKLGLNRIYTTKLTCISNDTALVLNSFLKTGCFEFVELNEVLKSTSPISAEPFFPNDPFWMCQWPLYNSGLDLVDTVKIDADIDMPEAWSIEQGDTSVIIAIIDGGINNSNNEFDGRLWENRKEIPGNGVDDDNNGYIDDENGWNFVNNDNIIDDKNGHGTGIASIIGSNLNNKKGMAGINGNSKLMILKVLDSAGNAYLNNVSSAINYSVNYGAKVINLSLAGPKYSQVAYEFINLAYHNNITVCAGSGNNNVDTIYYPAKFPNVIAVGATTRNDKRCISFMTKMSTGSNYGDSLDLMAPGDSISIMYYKTGAYIRRGGTSYSTAYVTGLVSLLISQDTSRTPDEVYKLITSTADDQVGDPFEDTPGYDKYYGYGRINAYKALLAGQVTSKHKKTKRVQHPMQFSIVHLVKNKKQLHITLNSNNQKLAVEFKLLTPQGRMVHSVNKNVVSKEFFINLPHLSRGIYFYSIDLSGNRHRGKLVF